MLTWNGRIPRKDRITNAISFLIPCKVDKCIIIKDRAKINLLAEKKKDR